MLRLCLYHGGTDEGKEEKEKDKKKKEEEEEEVETLINNLPLSSLLYHVWLSSVLQSPSLCLILLIDSEFPRASKKTPIY